MVTSLLIIGNDAVWNGGAEVETGRAATAAEGFASLSRRPWDVVVVGRVSDSSTDALVGNLARRYPSIPVIAVTEDTNPEISRHAWEVVRSGQALENSVASRG
jgi:hypothetical protein